MRIVKKKYKISLIIFVHNHNNLSLTALDNNLKNLPLISSIIPTKEKARNSPRFVKLDYLNLLDLFMKYVNKSPMLLFE